MGFALLHLSGCEAPRRPFEPPAQLAATTALLAPGPDAGIILVPIQGLPPGTARALGDRIAANLQQREIAASTRTAIAGSFILQGDVSTRPIEPGRAQLDFTWRLIDPKGLTGGSITQSETTPVAGLQKDDAPLIAAIADRAAVRIESLLRPAVATAPSAATAVPATQVLLRPVEGAPGDGRVSLTQAIRSILLRNNITLVDQEGAGTLLALGTVRMQNRGTVQVVQIEWRVLKSDGSTVGTVSQQNQIPAGLLDGPWGPIANQAASGSAEGLIQLLHAAAAGSGS
jgi:hypothetical protein